MKSLINHVVRCIRQPEIVTDKIAYIVRNTVHSTIYRWSASRYGREIPCVDGTRESYERLLKFLIDNVVSLLYDEEKRYFRPVLSYGYSYSGFWCDVYEMLARSFIGATYLLYDKDAPEISTPYRQSIRVGTNPESRYYWRSIRSDQRIVENASIAVGLMMLEDTFWNQYTKQEQNNIISYIEETSRLETWDNNWMWFRLFHFLFLERLGAMDRGRIIRDLLGQIDKLYRGGGWYNDTGSTDDGLFDEYNGCTYHYYGPLFCLLADSRYDDIKETIKERLREFCRVYISLFSEENLPIFWGRSMAHRFANLASFGMGVRLGVIEEQDYEMVKAKIGGTINTFLRNGALDHRGLFSCGFAEPIPHLLEPYCGMGSSYWALKAFCILLLEESHPFWDTACKKQNDGPAETRQTVIESIPIYIQTNERDEGFMLNGGVITKRWDKRKYNLFAYSNVFPLVLDSTYIGNGFVFLRRGKKKLRDTIVRASRESGAVFHVEWTVMSIPGLKGYTTMVPLLGGYCLMHVINAPAKLPYVYSGFPLPTQRKPALDYGRSNIRLRSSQYISELTVIAENRSSYGFSPRPANKCVVNKKTVVPWARSFLRVGSNEIVTLAQAARNEEYHPADIIKNGESVALRDWLLGAMQFVRSKKDHFYYTT